MNANKTKSVRHIETFFVIDLDRCLVDTGKLHNFLESLAGQETSLSVEALKEARNNTERAGETFDTISYIHKVLDGEATDAWLRLECVFIEKSRGQDLFEPYAREFLDTLRARHIPHGILTYGAEAWQLAKLEATGLITLPHLVTQIKEKGTLLSGWKQGDTFVIPAGLVETDETLVASSLVFLDDKPISFANIPPRVRGIHVLPVNEPPLPIQIGVLPPGVEEVKGLQGAAEVLFGGQ